MISQVACSCQTKSDSPLSSEQASFAIRNAQIFTAENETSFATAMMIRGEEIVYIGDDAGLEAILDEQTEVHDLEGRLILPGFHDVHQHTLEAHLPLIDCIIDATELDPENYIQPISNCRASDATNWILGWGHSIFTLMEAQRSPRAILDEAQPDLPVAIMEETSHSTWVNSRALELLNITRDTPDPQGGHILHDENGEPNGILLDSAGEYPWDLALSTNDSLREMNIEAIAEAMEHNSQFGITSAVDARTYLNRGYLEAYQSMEEWDELTVRMILSLWASPIANDEEQIALFQSLFHDDGGMLRIRQIKLYSDGLIQNTTAALLEPYSFEEVFSSPTGLSYFPEERLTRYIRELQPFGFDMHIHTIGDRAVRESLNAIEAQENSSSARHRFTHVELVHPDDLQRFAQLHVSADFQLGEHTQRAHINELAEFIGQERVDQRAWRIRELWETGANITISSDYDVGALNPLENIALAVDSHLPNVAQAVLAYTINGAHVMHSEEKTGSLEVGKFADFIILDRDIFSIPQNEIRETQVLITILGGEEVFRRAGFQF